MGRFEFNELGVVLWHPHLSQNSVVFVNENSFSRDSSICIHLVFGKAYNTTKCLFMWTVVNCTSGINLEQCWSQPIFGMPLNFHPTFRGIGLNIINFTLLHIFPEGYVKVREMECWEWRFWLFQNWFETLGVVFWRQSHILWAFRPQHSERYG